MHTIIPVLAFNQRELRLTDAMSLILARDVNTLKYFIERFSFEEFQRHSLISCL